MRSRCRFHYLSGSGTGLEKEMRQGFCSLFSGLARMPMTPSDTLGGGGDRAVEARLEGKRLSRHRRRLADAGGRTAMPGVGCGCNRAYPELVGCRVRRCDDGVIVEVRLAGGEVVGCRAAVVTIQLKAATKLLGETPNAPLAASTPSSIPIKAACLDVANRPARGA